MKNMRPSEKRMLGAKAKVSERRMGSAWICRAASALRHKRVSARAPISTRSVRATSGPARQQIQHISADIDQYLLVDRVHLGPRASLAVSWSVGEQLTCRGTMPIVQPAKCALGLMAAAPVEPVGGVIG